MKYRIISKSGKYYVQSENELHGKWIVVKSSDAYNTFDEAKEFLDNYIKPLVVLYEVEV
jgi:hypothetical protein